MINIFLDDIRNPSDAYRLYGNIDYNLLPWYVIRSYEQFVSFVKSHPHIDMISFDHDLADEHYQYKAKYLEDYNDYEEKTGYECAKWFCDYFYDNVSNKLEDFPKIMIHSQNIEGGRNIKTYIANFKKNMLI